jgi:glycosyltransferase involved in cell wall biosynthesis
MTGLSVLSFGSTRGLWHGESAEDLQRLIGYAEHLDQYVVIVNSYKQHGLKPRRFGPKIEAIPTNAFNRFDTLLRLFWIGLSILRTRKFSLIQAQEPLDFGLVAVLLGKIFRIPVNVCLYGPNAFDEHYLNSNWQHRLFAPITRWVMRRCAGIQVDGKLTARRLMAVGFAPDRIVAKPVVPANLGCFLEIERTYRDGTTPRLLFVGRFSLQKNVPLLIEAARLLKARGYAFELHLVGEGPREQEVRAAVERAGLGDQVKFRGVVSRDEISGLFAEADIFVLTSLFEGYARVLMEAAAAALPIVTTAVSGADEAVLDGETGYIIPIDDVGAAVEKLAALIENPDSRRRMGAAAREHIRPQLDPRTNAPAQLAIWKKIAANAIERRAVPRRLLLFNLVTDTQHPILGFTTQWIRELAARVESIDVITMCAGEIDVPANVRVHSAGRERGYSELRRVIEFYRHLFRILREHQIDGCFSHMIEAFSVLAGPVLRAKGIPLVTWYAHPKLNPTLKLAHLLSHRMVTSLPNAYPYRKDKLAVIGQGIDTKLFAPAAGVVAANDTILCVGRISPVKNHPTLIRALALLPAKFKVVILGATTSPEDRAYLSELQQLVAELHLAERVTFEDGVRSTELPDHFRCCAVHVNLTPAGFGDKVAWEAMACGRPCLVANNDFRETLGERAGDLLFRTNDAADLAAKIERLLEKTPAERDEIGAYLRGRVEQLHSLPRLAERILDLFADYSARGSRSLTAITSTASRSTGL